MDVISVLQGGISINRCLTGDQGCEFQSECEVNTKLSCLQLYIEGYLGAITLDEILQGRSTEEKHEKIDREILKENGQR
jgi:DNA-binding IscR family transcriptional regulator